MKLFIAPHNDDETLFGAFTIAKYQPHVIIVYDSYVQQHRGHFNANYVRRRCETIDALQQLGDYANPRHTEELNGLTFLGLNDESTDLPWIVASLQRFKFCNPWFDHACDEIFFPASEEGGHPQHNLVNLACREVFQSALLKTHCYLTYTSAGKSRSEHVVEPLPDWVARKHRALACYSSQHNIANCLPHFMGDINEYFES